MTDRGVNAVMRASPTFIDAGRAEISFLDIVSSPNIYSRYGAKVPIAWAIRL